MLHMDGELCCLQLGSCIQASDPCQTQSKAASDQAKRPDPIVQAKTDTIYLVLRWDRVP